MNWGKHLFKVRKHMGASQAKFAGVLGCSQSKLSKIERGELTMDVHEFERYMGFIRSQNRITLKQMYRDAWLRGDHNAMEIRGSKKVGQLRRGEKVAQSKAS